MIVKVSREYATENGIISASILCDSCNGRTGAIDTPDGESMTWGPTYFDWEYQWWLCEPCADDFIANIG
jgi:hypothetical protein